MDQKSNRTSLNGTEDTRLTLRVADTFVPKFFDLLQAGFSVKAVTGESIKAFLCGQLGLSEEYVETRIQTLFLDSKPVDDAATASIEDGSRLALSAAMPGVVGALLRKGGRYSAMRRGISYQTQHNVPGEKTGWVTIKLFNLILKEIGPVFLANGVWITGRAVQDFFSRLPESWFENILKIELDGNTIESDALLNQMWSGKHVFTKVISV